MDKVTRDPRTGKGLFKFLFILKKIKMSFVMFGQIFNVNLDMQEKFKKYLFHVYIYTCKIVKFS